MGTNRLKPYTYTVREIRIEGLWGDDEYPPRVYVELELVEGQIKGHGTLPIHLPAHTAEQLGVSLLKIVGELEYRTEEDFDDAL